MEFNKLEFADNELDENTRKQNRNSNLFSCAVIFFIFILVCFGTVKMCKNNNEMNRQLQQIEDLSIDRGSAIATAQSIVKSYLEDQSDVDFEYLSTSYIEKGYQCEVSGNLNTDKGKSSYKILLSFNGGDKLEDKNWTIHELIINEKKFK